MFTRNRKEKPSVVKTLDALRRKHTVTLDEPEREPAPKSHNHYIDESYSAYYSPYFHGYRSSHNR